MARGTGQTTKQLQAAPKDAIFIWCNNQLEYPRRLAHQLGRTDIKIHSINILHPHNVGTLYRSHKPISDVILDHAAWDMMTYEQQDSWRIWKA